MKNDLKISVIIPAYNAEKYLTATLDSVVSQTMSDSDYEIIIVNDGSSDHTADILEKYKNLYSNITVINRRMAVPLLPAIPGLLLQMANIFTFLTQMIFLLTMLLRLCLPRQ